MSTISIWTSGLLTRIHALINPELDEFFARDPEIATILYTISFLLIYFIKL